MGEENITKRANTHRSEKSHCQDLPLSPPVLPADGRGHGGTQEEVERMEEMEKILVSHPRKDSRGEDQEENTREGTQGGERGVMPQLFQDQVRSYHYFPPHPSMGLPQGQVEGWPRALQSESARGVETGGKEEASLQAVWES